MLVAWRNEVNGEVAAAASAAMETSRVLKLIPKQRTMVDLVDRVAS